MSEFAHDCVTLVELQLDLLKLDSADYLKRLIAPLVLFAATIAILLGCVPIALHSLALGLVVAGMPTWAAFLTSAGIGCLLAAIAAGVGWWRLQRASDVFQRSRGELQRNVHWFKSVLKNRGSQRYPVELTPAPPCHEVS